MEYIHETNIYADFHWIFEDQTKLNPNIVEHYGSRLFHL